MTATVSNDELVRLSRAAEDQYAKSPQELTFGQWVLQTCYPEVIPELMPSGRDFCGAQRTSDSRMYLMGMLKSGSLPLEPLCNYLEQAS